MGAELKLNSFVSGTNTGEFTGDHAVVYSVLCGLSGTQTIPLRCSSDGYLFTSGVN